MENDVLFFRSSGFVVVLAKMHSVRFPETILSILMICAFKQLYHTIILSAQRMFFFTERGCERSRNEAFFAILYDVAAKDNDRGIIVSGHIDVFGWKERCFCIFCRSCSSTQCSVVTRRHSRYSVTTPTKLKCTNTGY